jgi:hypothetical protein
MTSRFPRLVFLASLLVLVTSSYRVSDFLTTVASADVVSRTNAPNAHDDGVWQSARQVTTTSGASFRIGKHDLRTMTIARPRTLTAVDRQLTDELGNPTRDRSPRHSIPLLI